LAANHPEKVSHISLILTREGTLLNLLFSTKFDVMDSDHGRTQTTKGIWMAINADSNILVFDIEGTDSKERGE
jgi:hypothetical protein